MPGTPASDHNPRLPANPPPCAFRTLLLTPDLPLIRPQDKKCIERTGARFLAWNELAAIFESGAGRINLFESSLRLLSQPQSQCRPA